MKAQVAIEAMMIFVFMLLLFMFAIYSALDKQVDAEVIKKTLDLREECNKVSNFISSVYSAGNGTTSTIRLKHYLTLPGNGSLVLAESINTTEEPPPQNIAVLASEAGPTTQTFFDNVTDRMNPDWYKACFDDLGSGAGCQPYGPNPMTQASWDSIEWTFGDLIKNLTENPNHYTTVYLEDPTMYYDAAYLGTPYIDILDNWVSQGNILVMSEHAWCTEAMLFWFCIGWPYSNTSAVCDPPGCDDNNWPLLGTTLHQKGRKGWATIVNESEEFEFSIGESFQLEERNWIDNINNPNFLIIGRYEAVCSSQCFLPAADYMNNPSVASWDRGSGKVYYFGDFQILAGITQEDYTEALSQVIEEAYYILHFTSKTESCTVPVDTRAYENLHGLVKFTNENGRILAEIVGD